MINIKMTWEQLRGITTENISSVEQRKRRKISNTLEDIDMLNRTPEVETIDKTASYPMTLHVLTRFQCNSNMRIFVWLKLIISCDCSTIVFFSISSEMELKWAENWRILLLFMFEMYCKDKNGEKNKQLFVNYSSLAECKFELYIDTNSFWKKRFFPQLTLRICGPLGKYSILHTRKLLLSEVKIVHSWWRRQPLVSLDLSLTKTWRVSNLVVSHKRMTNARGAFFSICER